MWFHYSLESNNLTLDLFHSHLWYYSHISHHHLATRSPAPGRAQGPLKPNHPSLQLLKKGKVELYSYFGWNYLLCNTKVSQGEIILSTLATVFGSLCSKHLFIILGSLLHQVLEVSLLHSLYTTVSAQYCSSFPWKSTTCSVGWRRSPWISFLLRAPRFFPAQSWKNFHSSRPFPLLSTQELLQLTLLDARAHKIFQHINAPHRSLLLFPRRIQDNIIIHIDLLLARLKATVVIT